MFFLFSSHFLSLFYVLCLFVCFFFLFLSFFLSICLFVIFFTFFFSSFFFFFCFLLPFYSPNNPFTLLPSSAEKRQGSTIKDLDKIDVALPFTFNPFDPGLCPSSLALGEQLFAATATGNNHGGKGNNSHALIESLAGFGEGFDAFVAACAPSQSADSEEEDLVFKEVSGKDHN